MDQETFQQVIGECIRALAQASTRLTINLRKIKDASEDLQKKQKYIEQWGSRHLEKNRHLLIDYDDILPSDLNQNIQDGIQVLNKFKNDFPHYRNLIENEFKRLASSEQSEIARLLESDEEIEKS